MSATPDGVERGFVCGSHGCTPYVKRPSPPRRFVAELRHEVRVYPRTAVALMLAHAGFIGFCVGRLSG